MKEEKIIEKEIDIACVDCKKWFPYKIDITPEIHQERAEWEKEIKELIERCRDLCVCDVLPNVEGLIKSQKKCGNCHSKDILMELNQTLNKR